jgi:UDP-4-amino-4,6-dideoxy-N-acetyl-beta-L-altrosamine N-acetyltransferase
MIIRKYGITLRRLTIDDIELVRQKRNSEEIRKVMHYREEITPEMQLKWFESIDNFANAYYIVEYEGKKVALINNKNIDYDSRTSESGLFFWDKDYLNTFIPILSSLALIELGFYYLEGSKSYIHIMRDNFQAIGYAQQIGYELCEGQDEEENQLYYLSRENFEIKGRNIRKAAKAFQDEESGDGYVLLEPADYESGIAQFIEQYYESLGIQVKSVETENGKKFYR